MLFHTTNCLLALLALTAIFLNHPISITITIITQTLLTSLLITMMHQSPWFSYILFLVFLGGMLVLFSYITSLAPNMTFKMNMTIMMVQPPILLALLYTLSDHSMNFTTTMAPQMTMNKLFFQDMKITIALAAFLLIILFVVVKITSNHKGPLQTNL